MTTIAATSPFDIADFVRAVMLDALEEGGRPAPDHSLVAAGEVAIDADRMLAVAPEQVFRYLPNQFPAAAVIADVNAAGEACWGGYLGVQLVVLLIACVPTDDDHGKPPSADAVNAAHKDIWRDAALLFDAVADIDLVEGWVLSNATQTATAPLGGVVGVETRFTIGTEQESWCRG